MMYESIAAWPSGDGKVSAGSATPWIGEHSLVRSSIAAFVAASSACVTTTSSASVGPAAISR